MIKIQLQNKIIYIFGKMMPRTRFEKTKELRRSTTFSFKTQQFCAFMESVIEDKKSSFVCCSSNHQLNIDPFLKQAFERMSKEDQMEYYTYLVEYASDNKTKPKIQVEDNLITFQGFYRKDGTFTNKWEKSKIEASTQQFKITIIGNGLYTVNLRNYLMRKSGAKDKYSLVLMSIFSPEEVRIGFSQWSTLNKCYNTLNTLIQMSHAQALTVDVTKQLKAKDKQSRVMKQSRQPLTKRGSNQKVKSNSVTLNLSRRESEDKYQKTFIQKLMSKSSSAVFDRIQEQNYIVSKSIINNNGKEKIQFNQSLVNKIIQKKNLDIFHQLMPQYQLSKLQSENDYRLIRFSEKYKILQHNIINNKFKLIYMLPLPKTQTIPLIANVMSYPQYNPYVSVADVKINISSQNTAIVYQQHQPFSQYCYPRDYLYLRHLFCRKNKTYIIDKSIQNNEYPPFCKVTRGQIIYGLWMLEESDNNCLLYLQIEMDHKGILSKGQSQTLTIRYLQGITKVVQINQKQIDFQSIFNLNWDIDKNENNFDSHQQIRSKQNDNFEECDQSESIQDSIFQTNICSEIEDFYTVDDRQYQDMNQSFVIDEFEMQAKQFDKPMISYVLDSNNIPTIPNTFLKQRIRMKPFKNQYIPRQQDYLWKQEWNIDQSGCLRLVNQEKADNLTRVYKYSMASLGDDLIKGKQIKSLPIPVDVLGSESLLERIAKSFGLAQKFLLEASQNKDLSQKFKLSICFCLSSVLILASQVLERPFNPLLGQTYQGWLNGCPVYCQQISNEPSISAFLLIGESYKVYGKVSFKSEYSLNKQLLRNKGGYYTIQFVDGEKIYFGLPDIQINGLSFGDKTLALTNKCLGVSTISNLFADLQFGTQKKNFFSTHDGPRATIKGLMYKISKQNARKAQQSIRYSKKLQIKLDPANIITDISGQWASFVEFTKKRYFSAKKDIPCVLEEDKHALSSHSNHREDIVYRKRGQMVKAQISKQKLERDQRHQQRLRNKKR